MDQPGDRDRILAGEIRPEARCGDFGRAADPGVEDHIDVRATEDGVDSGRNRRAEANIEPARLAKIEPVLRRVVDDPAAELEPGPCQPGLDDDPPGMARRPHGGTDLFHGPSIRVQRSKYGEGRSPDGAR